MIVETLKYILFIYFIIGMLVTGGLVFNKENKTNLFLAVFIFLFSLELLDFLYVTSDILERHPQFYFITFPFYLLLGPYLFIHIKLLSKGSTVSLLKLKSLVHLIPFICYTIYTAYLFTFTGKERLYYVWENFLTEIMPLNYGKVFHVSLYAVLIVFFIKKNMKNWSVVRKQYIITIAGIYAVMAVLQSYFIVLIKNENYFLFYFFIASTLVLFVGYILYYKPNVLQEIRKRYKNSTLTEEDMQRIISKINTYILKTENIADPHLSLISFAKHINEKKHHVSQSISEKLNTSFNDLINRERVFYSKKLLTNPEYDKYKISAIASQSGFTNKSTFNRAFSKFDSKNPNEYRKRN